MLDAGLERLSGLLSLATEASRDDMADWSRAAPVRAIRHCDLKRCLQIAAAEAAEAHAMVAHAAAQRARWFFVPVSKAAGGSYHCGRFLLRLGEFVDRTGREPICAYFTPAAARAAEIAAPSRRTEGRLGQRAQKQVVLRVRSVHTHDRAVRASDGAAAMLWKMMPVEELPAVVVRVRHRSGVNSNAPSSRAS